MKKIRVLQLGEFDWSQYYTLPEIIEFYHFDYFDEVPKKPYDLVFIDRTLQTKEIKLLIKATKAYTLYITDRILLTEPMQEFYRRKMGKRLSFDNIQNFLLNDACFFFPKAYGEKYYPNNIAISQDFTGNIQWNGNNSVSTYGDFGEQYSQIIWWRNTIPVSKNQVIDFWLEYEKDPSVSIQMKVTKFESGSVEKILSRKVYQESDLEQVIKVENKDADGFLFVSIFAKGKGKLNIISLHDRYSRGDKGFFIPGGERYVTSKREEIFFYFDPGDFKPPLNIFFSGYKKVETFEGYNMIRKLGCPFLLISEARLEGGAFYMGSEEYENLIISCIKKYISQLHFSSEDIIMSGLSMGTFGAMYYGCDIAPHAILLGKPLTNIGTIAGKEKRIRPGGFPTSLDLLMYMYGEANEEAVCLLDQRFWKKFDQVNWSKTKFIITYMIEDDYDDTAYQDLISHVQSIGVQIYGKGIHGRHNDATGQIINWFCSQYEKIINEDFARGIEEK